MFSILHRYIIKSIISNILIIFLVLTSLSSIIKLFDVLRNLEKKNYLILEVFLCTILNLPKEFDLFLPIATLLGGLLGLSILETHNEIIIMQIAGLSKIQITLPVIQSAMLILLFNLASNEWLLPYSQQLIYKYHDHGQYNTYLFPEKNKNLWLVDNINLIFIENMLTTQNLSGINLYFFTTNKKLKKIVCIEKAVYVNQHWSLLNTIELDFSKNMCITKKNIPYYIWDTSITPKLLSILTINPRILSMSNLKYCIEYFNKVNHNSKYYKLILWDKIISPITGIFMIITAVSCNWGPFQHKTTSIRLLFGSIIGFFFYITHQVFGILSIIHNFSPIIGLIGPIVLLFTINIVIFWKYS